ncbi:AMP-binding protein [Kineococcus rubinsiae]|uniref:AMP-binding protein n=1 Tax=Kineococcus rubinsiae TaxID=2609562 RepID=UPI00143126C6|nr:AMP-binding protein [Kineococcus rubinsiae]NIZ93232.1 AMP-binding protein [Kineococcus rubinsiae]
MGVEDGRDAELPPLTEEMAQGDLLPRIVEVALALSGQVVAADGDDRLTGEDLLRRASAVRTAVLAANPEGHPVAVLRGHTVGAVAAVVGVIASGAPLVVLDPTTPAPRLRHYLESAGATVCVSDAAHAATAAEVASTVLDPEATGGTPDLLTAADGLLASPAQPGDTALIVYTSGSTGAPKGVACDHRSILHDAWTNSVGTGCYGLGDVVVHVLPLAFSAGIGVTLACLLSGARQELFDPRSRSIATLPAWMREVGANVLLASPAILRGALAALGPGGRLDGLKSLTMAGETVHGAELAAVRRAVGRDCSLRNRYGSTETWLMAEYVLGPDDPSPEGATPVGWAVPGARLRVEDEAGQLHDSGTGRVVVTGRWIGASYWGAPERTAESYVEHADGTRSFRTSDVGTLAPDGCLRLLGRSDHSVKIRGLLVEPGEVDAVLFARPEIREALVTGVVSERTGRPRLVAYVVPAAPRLTAATVRAVVRENLPAHMVPEEVVFLDALPRTDRGKLDRSALPAPADTTGSKGPRTDFERVVVGIFQRALDLPDIGTDADFFAMGGDSLIAEAIIATVSEELDVPASRLSTAMLAENPTPEAFARAIREERGRAIKTLVVLRRGGEENPVFLVAGAGGVAAGFRPLASRLPEGIPVYGLQANGLENRALPDWTVKKMAQRHLATVRQVQAHGPYRLGGHSLGGIIALEMAQQLRKAGEEVELLVILDSFPPEPSLMPPALGPGFVKTLLGIGGLLTTGLVDNTGLGHYHRFHRQGVWVQRHYRTEPYPGRTVVIVAEDDEEQAARSSWAGHLTGDWSMRRVPGEHTAVLRDLFVPPVAEAVSNALEALSHKVIDLTALERRTASAAG